MTKHWEGSYKSKAMDYKQYIDERGATAASNSVRTLLELAFTTTLHKKDQDIVRQKASRTKALDMIEEWIMGSSGFLRMQSFLFLVLLVLGNSEWFKNFPDLGIAGMRAQGRAYQATMMRLGNGFFRTDLRWPSRRY
jgi:hypothetical protein